VSDHGVHLAKDSSARFLRSPQRSITNDFHHSVEVNSGSKLGSSKSDQDAKNKEKLEHRKKNQVGDYPSACTDSCDGSESKGHEHLTKTGSSKGWPNRCGGPRQKNDQPGHPAQKV